MKKVISILLSVMFTVALTAAFALPASAANSHNVWVNGVEITSDTNVNDVLGDGTVSYDSVTNTLTLK